VNRNNTILIFIYCLGRGGAQRAAVNLANSFKRAGKNVVILTMDENIPDSYVFDSDISRITVGGASNSNSMLRAVRSNVSRLWNIRKQLKSVDPEFVISLGYTCNVWLAIASLGLGTVKIGSERVHPPNEPTNKFWTYLRKYTYLALNHVVVLTEETRLWIEDNTWARSVIKIPNGMVYPLPEATPVVDWPVDDQYKVILGVGRLEEQKQFDLLISAYAHVAHEFPEWKLLIVGSGSLKKELQNLIDKHSLNDAIQLCGAVGNLDFWYKKADLFVFPSKYEGFPNALLEALSYGLPCISFNCPTGPADLIKNNVNGVLINDYSIEVLSTEIRLLLSNEDKRIRLGQEGSKIKDLYSLDSIMSDWSALVCNDQ